MTIPDLILKLQHLTGADRSLDVAVGIVMGYKRHVKTVMTDKSGEKGRKVVWLYPSNGKESRVPHFTKNIDDAQLLAETLIPGCIGGFRWDSRGCTARIDDGPYFTAPTPAVALCIAALSAKHYQQAEDAEGEDDDETSDESAS